VRLVLIALMAAALAVSSVPSGSTTKTRAGSPVLVVLNGLRLLAYRPRSI